MRQCENADDCKITACLHKKKHFFNYLDHDNNCEADCDVIGGIAGSHCIELPSSYISPLKGDSTDELRNGGS
ncbi:MAG: hypothetical protein IMF19_16790 [Proteobacteria bacterium]|nr:hypothetical protein [Pseudomonadota bacterium]